MGGGGDRSRPPALLPLWNGGPRTCIRPHLGAHKYAFNTWRSRTGLRRSQLEVLFEVGGGSECQLNVNRRHIMCGGGFSLHQSGPVPVLVSEDHQVFRFCKRLLITSEERLRQGGGASGTRTGPAQQVFLRCWENQLFTGTLCDFCANFLLLSALLCYSGCSLLQSLFAKVLFLFIFS